MLKCNTGRTSNLPESGKYILTLVCRLVLPILHFFRFPLHAIMNGDEGSVVASLRCSMHLCNFMLKAVCQF